MSTVFEFYPANGKSIGLISIPHSGEVIPEEFQTLITDDLSIIQKDVDAKKMECNNSWKV